MIEASTTPPNFSRMKPRTLRENVVRVLREAIITGSLPPESELNQAHIALELGISRGPVREALGQLEQDGFIRNVPFKGVYVTPLTGKYVEDLYALRSELEIFAVVRFIHRITCEHVDQLNSLLLEMEQAALDMDDKRLVDLDLSFHRYIVEQADNTPLIQAWSPLEMGVRRCLHARHEIYESIQDVIGTHPSLVDAISRRDTEAASRLLRAHIIDAGNQLCELWAARDAHKAINKDENEEVTVDDR